MCLKVLQSLAEKLTYLLGAPQWRRAFGLNEFGDKSAIYMVLNTKMNLGKTSFLYFVKSTEQYAKDRNRLSLVFR